MQLLAFIGLGIMELVLVFLVLAPLLLTVYCVIDLIRSDFKDSNTKLLFLILVLLAPFIGSVIYLAIKRNYIKQQPFNY